LPFVLTKNALIAGYLAGSGSGLMRGVGWFGTLLEGGGRTGSFVGATGSFSGTKV